MPSTKVGEIVVQAFREGNFVTIGSNTTAEELVEAIPRLSNYVMSLMGYELGEMLRDWYVPGVYLEDMPLRYPLTPLDDAVSTDQYPYPPANTRLIVTVTAPEIVYLPAYPQDGARIAVANVGSTSTIDIRGNGRLIADAAGVGATSTGAVAPSTLHGVTWFYRADLGTWIRIQPLTSKDDEVPLPYEMDDLLVTGLAMRLAARYKADGEAFPPSVAARNADMLKRLHARYKQSERMPSSSELRQIMSDLS
jgi:hypothetical protein